MEGVAADKTAVTASGDTYVGDFDREKYEKLAQAGTAVEDLPVWRIKKICVSESGGATLYETKFPEGNANLYGYIWSDFRTLDYQFAKHK